VKKQDILLSGVLLEKLIVTQLVKKYSSIYRAQGFITEFRRIHG
jgi:hypothetical protein